jgi:nicotinate-nucleotide--dimethylbenzimidazole phosphoribosyltransferase
MTLAETIARIPTPNPEAEARAHLDSLTKPLGALGRLEDLATQLQTAGIRTLSKAAYVFAADHGLAQEPISAYPQEVTRQMVLNFLAGGAAVNVLARLHHATLTVVNCGVAGDLPEHPQLIAGSIRRASRNMLNEPALSPEECQEALELGLACARRAAPHNLIAVGEMGIGNTSSATLLTAALTGHDLAELTGAGTGLDEPARERKLQILRQVYALHQPHLTSSAAIFERLGGLEIAAMTGFYLGCAANGAICLIDGFISSAAAAIALALAPAIRPYLIASHQSHEPGHRILLAHMRLQPLLDLNMRLGEGTGALLAMPIVHSAHALYHEMATFASASVSQAKA